MKNLSTALTVIFLIAGCLVLSSCGDRGKSRTSSARDISPLSCVVLLPTQIQKKDTVSGTERIDNLKAGADFLNRTIMRQMEASRVANVIDSSRLRPQVSEVSGGKLGAIRQIGKQAQCDAVLMTTLVTFRQRQGGQYAVDLPAAAAFDMQLHQASTGRVLWSASFSETQSSLLDNLFTFGKARSRGFKWITVEELAAQGIQEKLNENPYFF